MWSIARKFGVSLEALIKANPQIKDANKIYPGQKINVPSGGGGGGGRVYTVRSGDSMWSIARKFNVSLDALIRANPQIKDPSRIYPGQRINIPVSGHPRGHSGGGFSYTVVSGDTMWLIAKRFNVSLNELIRANPQIKNPDRIYPGQVIFIPSHKPQPPHPPKPPHPHPQPHPQPRPEGENNGRLYTVRSGDTFFNIAQRYALNLDSLILANPQIKDPNRLQPGMQIYLPGNHFVKPGESLFSIAQYYGVSLNELIRINPQIKDPNKIDVGQKIAIPRQPNGNIATYTVKPGDTLYKIAQKYNVTVEALQFANPQIKDPNQIFPGQRINIPGPHLVQKGQSLFDIANLYGISLDALIRANPQIQNPNLIYPGQSVNIPPFGTQSQQGWCSPQNMCVQYVVQPGDSLFTIANMYNVSLQSVIRANPQITNPNQIFPGQVVQVPVGAVNFVTYVVKPGDSLYKIARMYGIPLQDLIRANPQIKNPNHIEPGWVIRIPVRTQCCRSEDFDAGEEYAEEAIADTYFTEGNVESFGQEESFNSYVQEEDIDLYRPEDNVDTYLEDDAVVSLDEQSQYQEEEIDDRGGHSSGGSHPIVYTVRKGDSLYSIAQKFGITVQQILNANPCISNPDLIYPGQMLIIVPTHRGEDDCLDCPWFNKEID